MQAHIAEFETGFGAILVSVRLNYCVSEINQMHVKCL